MMLLQKYGASKPILAPANKFSNISNNDKLDANVSKVISAEGLNENITGNKSQDPIKHLVLDVEIGLACSNDTQGYAYSGPTM